MKIPLFNLAFNDGTLLKECAIFEHGDDGELVVITDRKKAKRKLIYYPWCKVHFQNSMMNGSFYVKNLKSFAFSDNE